MHCETDAVDAAPQRLADYLGRHAEKDVQTCMEYLAARRAAACMNTLLSFGIPQSRLYATEVGCGRDGGYVSFTLQLEPPPAVQVAAKSVGAPDPSLPTSGASSLAAQQAAGMDAVIGRMATQPVRGEKLLSVPEGQIGVQIQQVRLSEAVRVTDPTQERESA